MLFRVPVFFYAILLLSVLAHLFVYSSTIRLFDITGARARAVLLALSVLLSLSFFTSIILVRMRGSPPAQAFYFSSALWTGFVINLFVLLIIGRLFLFGSKAAGFSINGAASGAVIFGAAFLFTCYGVYNAFNPVIKDIEVTVKGLPESWRNKTLVQISDVHLGAIHRAGFFRRVAGKINALRPDIVVITGDLFDGMDGSLPSFVGPLDSIEAKDGVFFITGNHENYLGLERVRKTLALTKIRTLENDVIHIDGVQIIGVSYPQAGRPRDVKRIITSRPGFRLGAPGILLFHQPSNIEESAATQPQMQKRTYLAPDIDFAAAKGLGAFLQLSGHTHCGQFFPFTFIANRIYGGYEKGLHTDGEFSIYTSCGTGSWGPPIRTGTTPEITVVRFRQAVQ